MNIVIPELPLGILVLLAFFGPYAVGALNGVLPFVTKPWQRKLVSIIVALVLAAVVIVFYYFMTGEPIGSPWVFAVIAILIVSASYSLITGSSAKRVEAAASTPPRIDGAHNI